MNPTPYTEINHTDANNTPTDISMSVNEEEHQIDVNDQNNNANDQNNNIDNQNNNVVVNNEEYNIEHDLEISDSDCNIIKIKGLSNNVKILAIIDILINFVIMIMISFANVFITICAYLGYHGATKYQPIYLLGYMIYLAISILTKLLYIVHNSGDLAWILAVIYLIYEIYACTQTYKLYTYLINSTDTVINRLRRDF